jgi:hypothetical protein
LTARVVVRPRLSAVSGSGSLSLTAELTPVIVGGRTVYRIKGRSTKPIGTLSASTGVAHLLDPTHFEVDVDFDQLVAGTAPGAFVSITAQLPASSTTIKGHLGLAVKRLGLTSRDVEEAFPSPTCTTELLSCLDALPDDALDLASCGAALEVRQCAGRIGVFVDAAMVDATLSTVDAKLTTFASDASALVGADRADLLKTSVRAQIVSSVEASRGLWLLSEASRSAVVTSRVDGPIDAAYARPLAIVGAPHTPVPGDVAATRQVVADALLGYLAVQDYQHSEFDRSYDELTKVFRTQHVDSLRRFRETVTPEMIGGQEFYIADWLGAHTEMGVDPATGTVKSVLVELD